MTNGEENKNSAMGYTEGSEITPINPHVAIGWTQVPPSNPIGTVVNPDATLWLTEQLDANKRIKELEDALADLITAPAYPHGTKARILEAFTLKYNFAANFKDPAYLLEQVLDDLEIK